jgi:hypothetical protein
VGERPQPPQYVLQEVVPFSPRNPIRQPAHPTRYRPAVTFHLPIGPRIVGGDAPDHDATRRAVGLEIPPELRALIRPYPLRHAVPTDYLFVKPGSDGSRLKVGHHAALNPLGKWIDSNDDVAGSILPGWLHRSHCV